MALNFQDIISNMQQQQSDANQANLQRYRQLLKTIRRTRKGALRDVEGAGQAATQRLERESTARMGQAEQDLISRGLGNTTIRSAVQRGIQSDTDLAQQSIFEGVGQQKAGLRMETGGRLAAAIEGRNDIGPDLSMMAGLLQAASAQDTSPISAMVPGSAQAPTGGGAFQFGGAGGGGGGGGAPGTPSGGGAFAGGGGGGAGGAGASIRYGQQDALDANARPSGPLQVQGGPATGGGRPPGSWTEPGTGRVFYMKNGKTLEWKG